MSHFAAALRALRRARDQTQQEFAALSGLAQNEVSYYERDAHRPSIENFRLLLAAAGDEGDDLLLAYLRDILPAEYHFRVRVAARPQPQTT